MIESFHSPQNTPVTLNAALVPDLRACILGLQPQNHTPAQLEDLLNRVLSIAESKRGIIRIGMYDGSFDPPHYGHVETARAAAQVARLDLLVLNCHVRSNSFKPDLSPHDLRTKMLSSYFEGDPMAIVSPLSRAEITAALAPHRIVGIIGSDTFNRFLQDGIANDFKTDEIFVSERLEHPLPSAPVSLDNRRVWYTGRAQLAQNYSSSTSIRNSLADPSKDARHPILNSTTQQIARDNQLYVTPKKALLRAPTFSPICNPISKVNVPDRYKECEVVQRVGLQNGLLSESFIFEVRDPAEQVVAYLKMLPPHREPEPMLRDEQAGLAFCNKLGIRGVSSPQSHFSSAPPALWVAKAPGETPSSLITRYDRGEIPAEDVYDALFAIGNFLQELHNRFRQPFDDRARDLLEVYIEHHEAIVERGDPLEVQDRAVQDAVQTFRDESDFLRKNGLHCALLHGDANCGNFLWDIASRHLCVIDLQRLGTQMRKGEPGFAAFEYRSLLAALDYYPNIGFPGLRGDLDLARDVFKAGYGDVNQHEDRFFTAIRFIRRALAGNERVHKITRPPVPI